MGRLIGWSVLGILANVKLPITAWAWTPGTHVYLGEALLRSLQLLPSAIAELVGAFPYDFLYGSIAADTSIAKKYAPAGRHCHSWMVGFEILPSQIRLGRLPVPVDRTFCVCVTVSGSPPRSSRMPLICQPPYSFSRAHGSS